MVRKGLVSFSDETGGSIRSAHDRAPRRGVYEVAERLAERARREHTTPEELATEAVRSYVGVTGISMLRRLGFVGLGHSGRSDISERAEEIPAPTLARDRRRHRAVVCGS